MIIIGSKKCARCTMVKTALKNKGVEYQYKDIESLNEQELKELTKQAESKGIKSLPYVVIEEDKELLTIQEVMSC